MAAAASPVLNAYPTGIVNQISSFLLSGQITIAAGTYPANGVLVTLSAGAAGVNHNIAPWAVALYSTGTGYVYRFDPAHLTVRIFQGGAAVSEPLAELATGASVAADTVNYSAHVAKG